jgi:ribosome-associated translation inhibitor RaiA
MLIQVNYANIDKTDAIDDFVHERVNGELVHMADRITRVEVHLHDDSSSHKTTPGDKRVRMEARPAGHQPLTVEGHGDDFQHVISDCAGKLGRALRTIFDRMRDH